MPWPKRKTPTQRHRRKLSRALRGRRRSSATKTKQTAAHATAPRTVFSAKVRRQK